MAECIAALGFFDGVHLGHGALLRRTRELADSRGCEAVAITFDRHPASVITNREEQLLTSRTDREYLMKTLYGIDRVEYLHFGRTLMHMYWETFLETVLLETGAVYTVCGSDYTFGSRGEGTAVQLAQWCSTHSIGCDIIPEVRADGQAVHSSLLRSYLKEGRFAEAQALMGHPYLLSGVIASGRLLGIPARYAAHVLSLPRHVLIPPVGVYVADAEFGSHRLPAIANIPDSSGDIHLRIPGCSDLSTGTAVRLFFRFRLREELTFSSREAFCNAMRVDELSLLALQDCPLPD